MAKFKIIITADYEVWGEGSGDVTCCMIEPTNELLALCEAHGSRLNIFIDICEYWAFDEAEKAGKFKQGYAPATAIQQQLIQAVKNGHDVQLHTHPQWLNHRFIDDHHFEVDLNLWRTSMLNWGEDNDRTSINGLLKAGKQTLDQMLKPHVESYNCNAFRAGDWCIQPEVDVLRALKEAGIKYDTSAARGIYRENQLSEYDFRMLPNYPQWPVENDLGTIDRDGAVTEVPITSAPFGMASQLMYLTRLARHNPPVRCEGTPAIKKMESSGGRIKRIWSKLSPQFRMLDFSDGSSLEEMQYIVKHTMRRFGKLPDDMLVPIVMIGHPKNFTDPTTLSEFLKWVKGQEKVKLDALDSDPFFRF